jgi:hydrophobe/amphiphile efflux-1 (HAE1) family protein
MSKFFILRPIFASVIAIILVLAGLVALKTLPIAQYPEIAPPTVTITATYPGASSETLSKTVAAPIEEQLSGIENLLYFSSTSNSANGQVTITVTFEVGADGDKAQTDVNNRVQIANSRLPTEVQRQGVTVLKKSNDILFVTTMQSASDDKPIDLLTVSNFVTINLLDEIKRVPGVSDAINFTARDYSIRIWLNVERMAQLGVTPADVQAAVSAQNNQYAAGRIGAEPSPSDQTLTYTVVTKGRLIDAAQFGDIVLRSSGPGGTLRVKDIARVELGAQSYDASSFVREHPGVPILVFLQSGANALDVEKAVIAKLEQLKPSFPEGVIYTIPFDTTTFVKASITEVVHTFVIAAILVVAVVFVFLQNWRATLIPAVAVPVSLIGTFAGLYVFGFSINTLTLFAMVLAIGIVVDDAIVVLENVERLMRDEKLTPVAAAIEAMREVQGAVVAIILVLCAVFIPVAFLGGIAGQLYKQFAVTVAIAVVLSGIVALTLTPALCALLLKQDEQEPSKYFAWFNKGFEKLSGGYLHFVERGLRHRLFAMLIFVGVLVVVGLLFWRVPGSFVPAEDQGYIISSVQLPDGASLKRTERTTAQLRSLVGSNEAIEDILTINGFDFIAGGNKTNAATMFFPLKDYSKRKGSAQDLVKVLFGANGRIGDGLVLAFNPPAIRGLGSAGGYEVYVQDRTSTANAADLSKVVNDFIAALQKDPRLGAQNTFFRPTVPQLQVDLDRDKAIALGVSVSDAYAALQATMGSLYVNDFNLSGRTFRVQLQADAPYRSKPEDIGNVYVRSSTVGTQVAAGQSQVGITSNMIPLKALITVKTVVGAEQLERYNGFLAAHLFGSGKPGVASGDAIKAVEEVAAKTLPAGYQIEWTAQAFQEKRTGNASIFAFGLAIIMVYLILAALYERWGLPAAVLMAVPFALTGALGFVFLRSMDNDIYFQIGLVVLIGLAAKNAILIVEFAEQALLEGQTRMEAALTAARLRFRPIVMTSLAFVLGVFPLVIATGAGAGSRQSMGTGVFGGMIFATFIAPIFIPLFFTLLARDPKPKEVEEAKREKEAAHKAMHASDDERGDSNAGVKPEGDHA